MILQELHRLYQRQKEDLPPEGFERKGIPFLIVINPDGTFADLMDTRAGAARNAPVRQFLVPKESGRVGKNAWKATNLFWDHYGYVLGWPKSEDKADQEMAKKQNQVFIAAIQKFLNDIPDNASVQAVAGFFERDEKERVFQHPLWSECRKIPGCNLSFMISGRNCLVCEEEDIQKFLANQHREGNEDADTSDGLRNICMLTGEHDQIERLHPRTPIVGAQSTSKIVSFQTGMGFDSYGREQSFNAPTGKRAVFEYATALNALLAKNSRQKLMVGPDTVVFWAEQQNPLEDVFADLFGEPAKENPEQMANAIRALYAGPRAGAPPLAEDLTRFFVLGLAPNVARIAIRFWHAGTVGQTARHIQQHFDDCAMVHGPHQPEHLSLFRLLICTAALGKSENIPPSMAGEMMKAILSGTPYPQTLLAAAVRRCRAEREITYPRAAIIKAVLARLTRYYAPSTKEVGMVLDPTNINIGYRLGRLFAVLEKIQEEANPGINATIRDRFYGAASGTPVSAFPQLLKLKNHHLSKLENRRRAAGLEKQLGEIMDGIQDFPTHLSMRDQGRFAVGYYHQRQNFFKKVIKDNIQENGTSLTTDTTEAP
ncbi:type I-C CRISPR-associated protein Cas8c/Csd1 [Desulfonatronum parangueonense]